MATPSNLGALSIPTTRPSAPTSSAAAKARCPSPLPRSSTRIPRPMPPARRSMTVARSSRAACASRRAISWSSDPKEYFVVFPTRPSATDCACMSSSNPSDLRAPLRSRRAHPGACPGPFPTRRRAATKPDTTPTAAGGAPVPRIQASCPSSRQSVPQASGYRAYCRAGSSRRTGTRGLSCCRCSALWPLRRRWRRASTPAGALDDPRAVVREATRAVENDGAAGLRALWQARLVRDSTDRAALLGLATLSTTHATTIRTRRRSIAA